LLDCPLNASSVRRHSRRPGGFTLVELLVVIGIIVILIGILLPVFHKVRTSAQGADTKNWINELSSAIERYQQDFHAYPGPLANIEMDLGDTQPQITYYPSGNTSVFPGGFQYAANLPTGVYDTTTQSQTDAAKHFTMSENLVLGLLGGLHIDSASMALTPPNPALDYDPSAVGGGPVSLSTVLPPKRYPPYLDSKQLSWQILNPAYGKTGHFYDGSGAANDSLIPCFVDRYTDPMPIIYMRAKVGSNPSVPVGSSGMFSNSYNPIVTNDLAESAMDLESTPQPAPRAGQYDISQIIAYTGAYTGAWPSLTRDTAIPPTGASIGVGKSAGRAKYTAPPAANNLYHGLQMFTWTAPNYPTMVYSQATGNLHPYQYPYDAYPYLVGPSGQVHEKDGYILISAGPDRVYGTEDDICNFGTAGP